MAQQTQQAPTIDVWSPQHIARKVQCQACGAEYSATYSDYFMRRDDSPMTCTHDGEQYPCELIERILISGTDHRGRKFYGEGWAIVKEAITVGDLNK